LKNRCTKAGFETRFLIDFFLVHFCAQHETVISESISTAAEESGIVTSQWRGRNALVHLPAVRLLRTADTQFSRRRPTRARRQGQFSAVACVFLQIRRSGVQGFLLPSRDLNDSARAAREVPRPGW